MDLRRSEDLSFRNIGFTISVGEDNDGELYYLTEQFLVRRLAGNDINGDGRVDGADLSLMYSNWAASGLGDLTGDGLVDGADIALVVGDWTGGPFDSLAVPEPTQSLIPLVLPLLVPILRRCTPSVGRS